MSQPSFSARERVVKMVNAAPSPTPLELPAVEVPSSRNTGFNFASDSNVTPGRTVSSTDITTPRISTGRISSAKIPDSMDYVEKVRTTSMVDSPYVDRTFAARV